VRERPQQIARPRVAIGASRPKPAPETPRMDRMARTSVAAPTNPTRRAPRMDSPAAPAIDLPREAPSKRAFRVANTKPVRGSAPKLSAALAPAPVQTATRAPVATPKRAARPAPTTSARRVPRPTTQLARASNPVEPVIPTPASRAGREAPEAPRGSKGNRTGVAGVPLGDLAACLSDREEDRLKQAVVAAVTTQEECVSGEGTYRFVETKNLNAFLMWIKRAPARAVSDRCVELGYALECLQSASRRAAR
jgi:hypothetical protein